ncbi:MAG: DUF305 domain-containing protein [Mycolicibacterium sp.]|nr:DUF305 domain-containing protein [Mycolicibacterium sp.]
MRTRIGAALLILAVLSSCGTHPGRSTAHNQADITFAQDMIPHHQQAVDMAALVPTRTADQTMHVIAAHIAADQRAEIKTLNELLAQWGAAGGTSMAGMGGMAGMAGMAGIVDQATMTKLTSLHGADFDHLWLSAMIGHHQGAVTMAQAELAHGENPDALHMAHLIITAQQREIAYMSHLLSNPQ